MLQPTIHQFSPTTTAATHALLATQDVFKFTLTRNDPSYPMPNNATTDGRASVVSGDNASVSWSLQLAPMFTIKEVTGTNQRVATTSRLPHLHIFKNDDGELDFTTLLRR